MLAKAGLVSLVLLCALLVLPASAAADSITMRLLGLKDFAPPVQSSWTEGESVEVPPAVRLPAATRVQHIAAPTLLLTYPQALTSHRKISVLAFESFGLRNTFSRNTNDTIDGRRSREEAQAGVIGRSAGGYWYRGASSGVPGNASSIPASHSNPAASAEVTAAAALGGGGGFGGLGNTSYGRNLQVAVGGGGDYPSSSSASSSSIVDSRTIGPISNLTSGSLADEYGAGGLSGSVLDEQLALSLEKSVPDRTIWEKTEPGPTPPTLSPVVHSNPPEVGKSGASIDSEAEDPSPSALRDALTDDMFHVPEMGVEPLLDVKPWVNGFTPNAVDEGQFVVLDPVTGTPVWTSDPLDELLEHGSLTPLVPTWEGPDASVGGIPNPEPATLLLLASGLLTVGARARSKYRRSKAR